MSWDKLSEAYQERGIVLALGAGVSVRSRIPTWAELLRRLANARRGGGTSFQELKALNFSLPGIASILERRCSSRDEFVDEVREALYRDFPFFPHGYPKKDVSKLVKYVARRNSTLRAIGTLCTVRDKAVQKFSPNSRIRSIATFNLDALLQTYVLARFQTNILKTIERPSASSHFGRINVYHVHGFLRYDRKAGDLTKEAPDAMVLTEQDYFDVFNNPTSVFNYTLLYLLREYPFLFIGLSMQDENLRRLLHYSMTEREHSYIAEGSPKKAKRKVIRHFAILKKPSSGDAVSSFESSLLDLGTRVLWIRNYSEIPKRLRVMYEEAGDSWSEVW